MSGRHVQAAALFCCAAFAIAGPAQAGSYKILYTFQGGADGEFPTGLVYVGGTLYGTTLQGGAAGHGTVFSVQPQSGSKTILYSFQGGGDGDGPFAPPIAAGNLLYGTTELGGGNGTGCGGSGCGTVYSVDPASGAESVVHSFQGGAGDGMYPFASLTYFGGVLYGTTFFGGADQFCENNCGTVFSVDPNTGAESVIYSFTADIGQNPQNAVIPVGDRLFGITSEAALYSVDLKNDAGKLIHNFGIDGGFYTNLIDVGGTLYGAAEIAGDRGTGAIISLNVKTHAATTVYSFKGGRQGSNPGENLIYIQRKLYGTTTGGGAHKAGTLFSVDLATGKEKVLHNFGRKGDGFGPETGVINVGGTFYGTAGHGGAINANCSTGCGVVFSYKP